MERPDRNENGLREDALIRRFRDGETDAFAGLVDLYKDRVHRFILCILGPDREAEDIAQEVFVQIYGSLASFKGRSALCTWIYAVARNVCRRRLRARGRAAHFTGAAEDGPEPAIPDPAPPPEAALESAESAALVRSAVENLPPIHRAAVFLSCWERLTYEEIAEALDVPVGTVRSRLHNAMKALERALGGAPAVKKREEP